MRGNILHPNMISFILTLLTFIGRPSVSRVIDDEHSSVRMSKILTRFTLIPMSRAEQNDGNYGTVDIRIDHNIRNGSLWILGLDKSREEIEDLSSASHCSRLIRNAAIRGSSAVNFSAPIVPLETDGWHYSDSFHFVLNDGGYQPMYWMIINCNFYITSYTNFIPNGHFSSDFTSGPLYYRISATFENASGGLKKHMSFEEIGMLELSSVFMCLHFVLMCYAAIVRNKLISASLTHKTADLLFLICCLQPFKFLFLFAYWYNYAEKGKSKYPVWACSLVIDGIITALFICLFAILSSGWSIFRRKLPVLNRLRMAFFVSAYMTLALGSALWIASSDVIEETFLIYYTSGPGIAMLVLLVVAGIRYNILCESVMKKFSFEPVFLSRLRFIGSVYMFAQPLMMLCLQGFDETYTPRAMVSFWSCINLLCEFIMLVLYDPKVFKNSFPFHAFIEEMKIAPPNGASRKAGLMAISGGTDTVWDEDGRVRALNTFDKMHLSRLKDLAKSLDSQVTLVNSSHIAFQEILNKVAGDNLISIGVPSNPERGEQSLTSLEWSQSQSRRELDPALMEDDDEDEHEDVTIRRGQNMRISGGVPTSPGHGVPFRPLSTAQKYSSSPGEGNPDDYEGSKMTRFQSFEERQLFRDKFGGKDIPIDDSMPVSALERALETGVEMAKYSNTIDDYSRSDGRGNNDEPRSEIIRFNSNIASRQEREYEDELIGGKASKKLKKKPTK